MGKKNGKRDPTCRVMGVGGGNETVPLKVGIQGVPTFRLQ